MVLITFDVPDATGHGTPAAVVRQYSAP